MYLSKVKTEVGLQLVCMLEKSKLAFLSTSNLLSVSLTLLQNKSSRSTIKSYSFNKIKILENLPSSCFLLAYSYKHSLHVIITKQLYIFSDL